MWMQKQYKKSWSFMDTMIRIWIMQQQEQGSVESTMMVEY